AVIEAAERVSGTIVLKQLGAVSPACSNCFVRSIPPSKKSGETILFRPTPPVTSDVSHGVPMVLFHGLPQALVVSAQLALVVAQSESPPVVVLQSAVLVPIGRPLQPPVALFGLSLESMQPPSPESGPVSAAAHWKALIELTPPPFENSETTRTSLFW